MGRLMARLMARLARLLLPAVLALPLPAQAPTAQGEPPLPATGLDFSGIDAFWPVADLLMIRRDSAPPASVSRDSSRR